MKWTQRRNMNIIVSACLLGENVKYNGGNNHHDQLIKILRDIISSRSVLKSLVDCRFLVPQLKLETDVLSRDGKISIKILQGCNGSFKDCSAIDIKVDFAILQSRSPGCGSMKFMTDLLWRIKARNLCATLA